MKISINICCYSRHNDGVVFPPPPPPPANPFLHATLLQMKWKHAKQLKTNNKMTNNNNGNGSPGSLLLKIHQGVKVASVGGFQWAGMGCGPGIKTTRPCWTPSQRYTTHQHQHQPLATTMHCHSNTQHTQLHLLRCNGKINKYSCWKFTCKHANCKAAAANEGLLANIRGGFTVDCFVFPLFKCRSKCAPKMWQFRKIEQAMFNCNGLASFKYLWKHNFEMQTGWEYAKHLQRSRLKH